MIKTNGKAIGINTAPDPDFDFTVCNMPNGQHRLIRGVDVYDYVNTLNAAGKLIDENGLVKYKMQDKLSDDGLFYDTSTNTYTDSPLYSYVKTTDLFYEPSTKSTKLYTDLKAVDLDLSNYEDYNYLIVIVDYRYSTIYVDKSSNRIEYVDSCETYNHYYDLYCFKINEHSHAELFVRDRNTKLSSYKVYAVKDYQDYQEIPKIIYLESLKRVTRFIDCAIILDTFVNNTRDIVI